MKEKRDCLPPRELACSYWSGNLMQQMEGQLPYRQTPFWISFPLLPLSSRPEHQNWLINFTYLKDRIKIPAYCQHLINLQRAIWQCSTSLCCEALILDMAGALSCHSWSQQCKLAYQGPDGVFSHEIVFKIEIQIESSKQPAGIGFTKGLVTGNKQLWKSRVIRWFDEERYIDRFSCTYPFCLKYHLI